jgi:hypothetical protein
MSIGLVGLLAALVPWVIGALIATGVVCLT